MGVDEAKVARLAYRLMKATTKFEGIRRGDYRRSELERAEQTMLMARNRLFDAVLLYDAEKGATDDDNG
jgi:hypothetical protein